MRQLYFVIFMFLVIKIDAQAIRKNYQEMTSTEKINLVNAFYQLRTGSDLISDLASFHGNHFVFDNTDDPNGLAIHMNLPDRPENDIFFAWHRRQMFEVEQAMQDIDPSISLPFWDSSIDQSVNSSLWDQNFLGQFDTDWNLRRNLGGASGSLPTPQLVIDINSNTDFLLFSNATERGDTHTGAHIWVGGDMRTGRSPRDPAFYLHHINVDRLWSIWQEENQSSVFQMTSMIRYDGTYVFDGETLPLVNPNDIVDTRYFGTFYAENGFVEMDNYTVSNEFNAQENFYYQFTIQAGNNFIVPLGNNCKFESVNEIILKPGFEVENGGNFVAVIDIQPLNKLPISKRDNKIVRNQIPFEDFGDLVNVYDKFGDVNSNSVFMELFPNPFSEKITVQMLGGKIKNGEAIIYDMMGRVVKKRTVNNLDKIDIVNLNDLAPGVYILHIINSNNELLVNKKVVKVN